MLTCTCAIAQAASGIIHAEEAFAQCNSCVHSIMTLGLMDIAQCNSCVHSIMTLGLMDIAQQLLHLCALLQLLLLPSAFCAFECCFEWHLHAVACSLIMMGCSVLLVWLLAMADAHLPAHQHQNNILANQPFA